MNTSSHLAILLVGLSALVAPLHAESYRMHTSEQRSEYTEQNSIRTPGQEFFQSLHEFDNHFRQEEHRSGRGGSHSRLTENYEHLRDRATRVEQCGGFASPEDSRSFFQEWRQFERDASSLQQESSDTPYGRSFSESLSRMREQGSEFQMQSINHLTGEAQSCGFLHKMRDLDKQVTKLESRGGRFSPAVHSALTEVHSLHDEALDLHLRMPGVKLDHSFRNRLERAERTLREEGSGWINDEHRSLFNLMTDVNLTLELDR
ncbi:hypothetical protein DES53_11299 [Roseimicrobium gellanilyticum]|uniref:Uncharacterized protein n=1 Tax=Roseimicrobium gellanilyticum TaxID=748857 RepID=A0A366H7F7_9BACT|nr:hypothetical protein [Roseimicrobium gellanilyticum]RBP38101.1 hypothetical protein DES53_11299 [Roseimicrobium gellanilyticum]